MICGDVCDPPVVSSTGATPAKVAPLSSLLARAIFEAPSNHATYKYLPLTAICGWASSKLHDTPVFEQVLRMVAAEKDVPLFALATTAMLKEVTPSVYATYTLLPLAAMATLG